MKIAIENGVSIPASIQDGSHPFFRLYVDQERNASRIISVAEYAHPVDYFGAHVFISTEPPLSSTPPLDVTDRLMRRAAILKEERSACVGAALITESGAVLSSVELQTSRRAHLVLDELNQLASAFSASNPELTDLLELVDESTSVHAESIVLVDALSKGEIPLVLAVTRRPCLACCRLIRLAKVPFTTYLSHRSNLPPRGALRILTIEALGGHTMRLYGGAGGAPR